MPNSLIKLLGIDSSNCVSAKAPFVDETQDIKFYDEPNINYRHLDEMVKPMFYVNYLTLIPKYLKAITAGDSKSIKSIPTLSKTSILDALEVEYDYKEFLLFNVFQALRYRTRASREDTESERTKIVDLKDHRVAMDDIRCYIREHFESNYQQQLSKKAKVEHEVMGDYIASQILRAETYDEMVSVWRNGVVRNNVTYKISTPSNLGFKTLAGDLFVGRINVPQSINIAKVLLLGVDEHNEAVWNHGGVCFLVNLAEMKSNFLKYASLSEWSAIMTEFKKRGKHIYRDHKNNRQGHGNDKPSYWAMGYESMVEFRRTVTVSEFKLYCKNHLQCCGVRNLETEFLLSLNDDT